MALREMRQGEGELLTEALAGKSVERKPGRSNRAEALPETAEQVSKIAPAAETPTVAEIPADRGAPVARREPVARPDAAAPAAGEKAPAKRNGKRKLIVLLLASAGLVAAAYYGARWWTVDRFLVHTDDAYVTADITEVAAKVAGYVVSVDVQANQSVNAGDVIAQLDDGDYRLALQSARAKADSLQATVDRIERQVVAARAAVDQSVAQIAAAKADLFKYQNNFERQQSLVASRTSSEAVLDTARADRDRSIASVKSAEAGLAVQKANVDVLSAQKVEAVKALAEQAAVVAKAERDLDFTVIRAPAKGVIGNKAVDVGNYVQAGTRLTGLVPLQFAHIDANFKETQLGEIKPGQSVEITVDALPGEVLHGTVDSVSPGTGSVFSLLPPENATGNFTKIVQRVPVRITVPLEVAERGVLRPGLSIIADVDTRTGPNPRHGVDLPSFASLSSRATGTLDTIRSGASEAWDKAGGLWANLTTSRSTH